MPDNPNGPNVPVLGGMKTFQFACAISGCFNTKAPATAIKTNTAVSLTKTTPVLKVADSLIPMMRSVVTASIARNAIKLNLAVTVGSPTIWSTLIESVFNGVHRPSYSTHWAPGTSQICGGRLIP